MADFNEVMGDIVKAENTAKPEEKVDYFDKVEECGGIHIKHRMHWSEIKRAARALADGLVIADEKKKTMVIGGTMPVVKTYVFLSACTDCDMTRFEYPDTGDLNEEAMMDWVMEHGMLDKIQCYGHGIESWERICDLAYEYANIIVEQHNQEMDFGHRLTLAFGDVLDGSTSEIVENAAGLGETLIDLIGKSKEAAKPQGGIVNFAKKK